MQRFGDRLARPVVVGGTGQNGGDAWVVARRLLTLGYTPEVFLLGEAARVRGDAASNLKALTGIAAAPQAIAGSPGIANLKASLGQASVVVDGIFGTGLDRKVTGIHREAIEAINAADAPCVSLDLPSGVDANVGSVHGSAVQASLTVTFAAHKRGLWQHPGRSRAGSVVLVDIGVPRERPALEGGTAELMLEPADVASWFTARRGDAHKGSAGHVLIVAGSAGKTGAAMLSGLGALRAGAGLVSLLPRGRDARQALDQKALELMTLPLDERAPAASVLEHAKGKAAAVVGPGFGLSAEAMECAFHAALSLPVPTVLDADALTAVAKRGVDALRRAAAPRVLTPHPGEAARLLGTTSEAVQANRYAAATELGARSGQVVVLKGAGTIVASPGGRLRVCGRGTPAMATAGTGDVLSGAVAAALVGIDDVEGAANAASAMVILHALAGERAARADRGLLASELAHHLPLALRIMLVADSLA